MTRPEIAISIIEAIASRQGGVPMTPRDVSRLQQAVLDLRAGVSELRTAATRVTVAPVPVGPFVPRDAVVVAFPGRARA